MTKEENCNTISLHEFIENFRVGIDHFNRKIVNGMTVNSKFEYFDFEKKMVDHMVNNRFSLFVKSRQMHMTTLLACYTAWRMAQGNVVGYYANKAVQVHYFIQKVKLYLKGAGIKLDIDSKKKLRIANGQGQVVGICTLTGCKGYTLDDILFDDAAFIDKFDEAFKTYVSTLSTGGNIIVASTPYGYNQFFTLYDKARRGENEFKIMTINCKDNPRFDEKWENDMKLALNYNQRFIDAELYGKFVFSDEPEPPKKKNKKNIIQFRIDDDLYHSLCEKLIENDVSVSVYMRNLILKDVNS